MNEHKTLITLTLYLPPEDEYFQIETGHIIKNLTFKYLILTSDQN